MEKTAVYEPLAVKKQMIKSATEAATMILRIGDVIAGERRELRPCLLAVQVEYRVVATEECPQNIKFSHEGRCRLAKAVHTLSEA